jgi:hypothetical protein
MDEIEQTSQDINTVAERILSEGTTLETPGDAQWRSLVPTRQVGSEVKGG